MEDNFSQKIEPLKKQIKSQSYLKAKPRHMMVFNLPQDSDSESDFVPNQSQISEIQAFQYDHLYYNKLRSRLVQDRQNFGFRQIIINYPSLNHKLIQNRQKRAAKRMKEDINNCKIVKFQENKLQPMDKLQHFNHKRTHYGNKLGKIQEIYHKKRQFPIKIQQRQQQPKQSDSINVPQTRYRKIKKPPQYLLLETQIQIEMPQCQYTKSPIHDLSKKVNQQIRQTKIQVKDIKDSIQENCSQSYSSSKLTDSDEEQQT